MSQATADGPVVALDVGGSAMKGAVIDQDGRVAAFHRWPTPRSEGPAAVVDAVLTAVGELLRCAEGAVAVGLVVPGLVDDLAGIALYSENIGWLDVPFRKLVAESTGLPVASPNEPWARPAEPTTCCSCRSEPGSPERCTSPAHLSRTSTPATYIAPE